MEVSDNDLIEALASEAVSANVEMDLIVSKTNRTTLADRDDESGAGNRCQIPSGTKKGASLWPMKMHRPLAHWRANPVSLITTTCRLGAKPKEADRGCRKHVMENRHGHGTTK